MLLQVLPYVILIVLVGSAAVLLTSKKLSEKFVAVGILPRQFLGLIPALQVMMRVLGLVLVAAGATKIAMDSGWIDSALVLRYAFPACAILLGIILLALSKREN